MIDSLFASHPVLAVLLTASLMGIIGWLELTIGKSPRSAYLTWAVAGIGLTVYLIGRLFS